MAKRRMPEDEDKEPANDPEEAGKWQYSLVRSYGIEVEWMSKGQAFGILRRFKQRKAAVDVAAEFKLIGFTLVGPSPGQLGYMRSKGIPADRAKNRREAGLLLDAELNPALFFKERMKAIKKAQSKMDLDEVSHDMKLVRGVLPDAHAELIVRAGKTRREAILKLDSANGEIPE